MSDQTYADSSTAGTTTGTPVQSPQQQVDWAALYQNEEARRKGLQTTLNKEQEAARAAKAQFEQLVAQLTQEKMETEKAFQALKAEFDGTKTKVGEYELKVKASEEAAATAAKGLQRFQQVAKAGLVEEESAGLLRNDLEGEEFDKYLEAFAGRVVKQAKQMQVGTTPAGGAARQAPEPIPALRQRMFSAQLAGDTVTYNQLYDELISRMKQGEK